MGLNECIFDIWTCASKGDKGAIYILQDLGWTVETLRPFLFMEQPNEEI
jgi:hypothetical protein